jgi:flagellar protein FliL
MLLMAKADDRDDDDKAEAAPAKSGSKKMLLLVLAGVLVLGVAIAGTVMVTKAMLGGSDAATEDGDAAADSSYNKANDKSGDKKKKKGSKKGAKDDKGAHDESKGAVYLSLEPPFVVNAESQGSTHYLQVSIDVMAREPEVIEDVKKHMPVIRNNLIMLLSSQSQAAVSTRDGKEKLRADALAEIRKVLQEQTGKPGVEAVYFTIFVMQ